MEEGGFGEEGSAEICGGHAFAACGASNPGSGEYGTEAESGDYETARESEFKLNAAREFIDNGESARQLSHRN